MNKPTKPGYYWVRMAPNCEPTIVLVSERQMSCDNGRRIVTYLGYECFGSESDGYLNDVDAGSGFEDSFKSDVGGWEWLCEVARP